MADGDPATEVVGGERDGEAVAGGSVEVDEGLSSGGEEGWLIFEDVEELIAYGDAGFFLGRGRGVLVSFERILHVFFSGRFSGFQIF